MSEVPTHRPHVCGTLGLPHTSTITSLLDRTGTFLSYINDTKAYMAMPVV